MSKSQQAELLVIKEKEKTTQTKLHTRLAEKLSIVAIIMLALVCATVIVIYRLPVTLR